SSGSSTGLLVGLRLGGDLLRANVHVARWKFVVGVEAVGQVGKVVDARLKAFGVAVGNRHRNELRHDIAFGRADGGLDGDGHQARNLTGRSAGEALVFVLDAHLLEAVLGLSGDRNEAVLVPEWRTEEARRA